VLYGALHDDFACRRFVEVRGSENGKRPEIKRRIAALPSSPSFSEPGDASSDVFQRVDPSAATRLASRAGDVTEVVTRKEAPPPSPKPPLFPPGFPAHDETEPAEEVDAASRETRVRAPSSRESALIKAVYDTEREFLAIKDVDGERALRIEAVRDALLFVPALYGRDDALLAHEAAKRALLKSGRDAIEARKDHVVALGLLARQRDDEHRERGTRDRRGRR
jgi:hypothetical protein